MIVQNQFFQSLGLGGTGKLIKHNTVTDTNNLVNKLIYQYLSMAKAVKYDQK